MYNLTSNRVLTSEDREQLRPVIEELHRLCPDIMSRKYPDAVFQNAFNFQQVISTASKEDSILIIGGYEDPIGPALQKLGFTVRITDPQINGTDDNALATETKKTGIRYDIIIACSVLEHVNNDAAFIGNVYEMLNPLGRAFLTTDFKEGWSPSEAKPSSDVRLYTSESLYNLLLPIKDCLLDPPSWGFVKPYFTYESVDYCFASISFSKLDREL